MVGMERYFLLSFNLKILIVIGIEGRRDLMRYKIFFFYWFGWKIDICVVGSSVSVLRGFNS